MSEALEDIENACDNLKCEMENLDDNRDDESYENVVATIRHITYMADELINNPLEPAKDETCD